MKNFISDSIDKIAALLRKMRFSQVPAVLMVGLILLTTNISPVLSKQDAIGKIDKMLEQDRDPNRPKTTAEWQQQARETKGEPGEKLKRIGEQSADAVKEFGSMYPEVAKNSVKELKKELKQ
jgi:hypothetical protein